MQPFYLLSCTNLDSLLLSFKRFPQIFRSRSFHFVPIIRCHRHLDYRIKTQGKITCESFTNPSIVDHNEATKITMVAETKNVLVVLVTIAFLFGPVSVEKCNHRHTILGRKWAQLFEDRFSLTWGVISFSLVLKHFLRQFSPFFFSEYPTMKLYTKRIKLNRTYSFFLVISA